MVRTAYRQPLARARHTSRQIQSTAKLGKANQDHLKVVIDGDSDRYGWHIPKNGRFHN